ncbi:MAG: pyrophosphate--fructose-6-phosphate 1-phosphotransferase [Candidatus Marinimicrobia bacterium]|jgi:pyrophosphate--fructose-6-phosphate 1-phosphotransferase|nr:pyrophosphate--fructose-6-phosphate 1-phosphotransferase [Candidatus Neomarinimicrobiota bacterium]MDP6593804.1 pyrophosphate--fructose-6-phosphate 1-phosphotransferase [Candidatus Neomarinimicrobiota bacterium]MDP6837148.1 pyrophosphate--fructose-6-phosphate 1-phosphotransferase [Candidatus Neomarinimicrobiota bacterium]
MAQNKIAFLTSGGIAPCLSASIGALMLEYNHKAPESDMLGYLHGYRGLLLGKSLEISTSVRERAQTLLSFGGSPIGNSRVKLTNVEDCVKRGFIQDGEDPLKVAARQLLEDGISILHTIGGDDTNSMAASLVAVLKEMGVELTVVGLPKTVDNDVYPIVQTLGAATAAEQGAVFFENIANENTTSRRQLIIHEVMGRHCGWLTAATAHAYRERLKQKTFLPEILVSEDRWDVDAVYVPETDIDFSAECERLMKKMNEKDGVNIFLSEGAGIDTIVKEKEAMGEEVERDAFGHVKLDLINPGLWFAEQFGKRLKSDKILVQKSGYFARSAAPNGEDLDLIKRSATMAVKYALSGESGVVGLDTDRNSELSLINFDRIKGGKPFDVTAEWFNSMLVNIEQA